MAMTGAMTGDKLKVFVSYSRTGDLDLADQLVAVLEWQRIDVLIDRKGIQGAEDWKERLGQLILESDTVIFLLSPDSADSEICAWEVEEAERRGKRIIPALCRPLDGKQPPARLRDLNYIYLYPDKNVPGSGFGTGQVSLIEALSVDIEWLREHTRLEERAAGWDAGGRHADSLLRGAELSASKAWRDRRPANAPDLTGQQRAFLAASEEAETERFSAERKRLEEIAAAQEARQKAIEEREAAVKREAEAQKARARSRRVITWGGAAAALMLILGVAGFAYEQTLFAWQQTINLQRQQELTQKQEEAADEARKQADLAEANFRRGQVTESHFRAEQSKAVGADAVTAALLALEGLRDETSSDELQRTRPMVNEAWHALYAARLQQHERRILTGYAGLGKVLALSPDGSRILTAAGNNTGRLWDADGNPLATLEGHTDKIMSAAFAPDGSRMVTTSEDNTARLWAIDGKPLVTLRGHAGPVDSAVFSPDGRRILTTATDNTARLWGSDGSLLATLYGNNRASVPFVGLSSAAFAPDGRRILTESGDNGDNTARLWDSEGNPLATLQGHTGRLSRAVFSPDGRRILTAADDNTARLWAADGKPLTILQGHTGPVTSAAFSPDGRRILTASGDHTARLWDADGKPLATLQHTQVVNSAVFASDGRILTASTDGTARLWDGGGKPLAVLQGHTDRVHTAMFSPDGRSILTASNDNTVRLWDAGGKAFAPLNGHTRSVDSVVFASDGRRILTSSYDNTARLWDGDGKPLATLQGHAGPVTGATFSPDGRRILTASDDKTARLWDADGKPLATLQGHAGRVHGATFSPDGRRILTTSDDNTARLWDAAGKPLAILPDHTDRDRFRSGNMFTAAGRRVPLSIMPREMPVHSAAFSRDSRRILTTPGDNTARLWDADGKPLATLGGHAGTVDSAVLSPDGRHILTVSADSVVRLWDTDGKPLATLQESVTIPLGLFSAIPGALFSPDGRILTVSADNKTQLWDAGGKPLAAAVEPAGLAFGPTFSPDGRRLLIGSAAGSASTAQLSDADGNLLATLLGFPVVFSPDSRRILTASADGAAHLWDSDGSPLATLQGHKDTVFSAAFSPDGRRILTASLDGAAWLWEAFPNQQELIDLTKTEVPRCLTTEQRQLYFLPPDPPRWCYTMRKWPYDAERPAAPNASATRP